MMSKLLVLAALAAPALGAHAPVSLKMTTLATKYGDNFLALEGMFDATKCSNNKIKLYSHSAAAYTLATATGTAAPTCWILDGGCTATTATCWFSGAFHAHIGKYLSARVSWKGQVSPMVQVTAAIAAGSATAKPTVVAATTAITTNTQKLTITGTNFVAHPFAQNTVAIGQNVAPAVACTEPTCTVLSATSTQIVCDLGAINTDCAATAILTATVTSKVYTDSTTEVSNVQVAAADVATFGAAVSATVLTASTAALACASFDTLTLGATNLHDDCALNVVTFSDFVGTSKPTIVSQTCTASSIIVKVSANANACAAADHYKFTVAVNKPVGPTAVAVSAAMTINPTPTITAATTVYKAATSQFITISGTGFSPIIAQNVFALTATAGTIGATPTVTSCTSTMCVVTVAALAENAVVTARVTVNGVADASGVVISGATLAADPIPTAHTVTAATTAAKSSVQSFTVAGTAFSTTAAHIMVHTKVDKGALAGVWQEAMLVGTPTATSLTVKLAHSFANDVNPDVEHATGGIVSVQVTQYGLSISNTITAAMTAGDAAAVTAAGETVIAAGATSVTFAGTGFATASCQDNMLTFTGAGAPTGKATACTATSITATLDAAPTGVGLLSVVVKVPWAAASPVKPIGSVASSSPTTAPTAAPVVFSAAPATGVSVLFVSLLSVLVALFC